MNRTPRPARSTTHAKTKGTPPKRFEQEKRLGRARGILGGIEIHSDARIRRACKTILALSSDHAERQLAADLLAIIAPIKDEATQ